MSEEKLMPFCWACDDTPAPHNSPCAVCKKLFRPSREEVSGEEVERVARAIAQDVVPYDGTSPCVTESQRQRRKSAKEAARLALRHPAAMNPKPAEAASAQNVERAASIIRNWRAGNAGEDDAKDTARLVLSLATADKLARRMGGRFVPHDDGDAKEIAVSALQSACESDPADPEHPDTICISTNDFETIVHCAVENWAEAKAIATPATEKAVEPVGEMGRVDGWIEVVWNGEEPPIGTRLYTAPPAANVAAMREAVEAMRAACIAEVRAEQKYEGSDFPVCNAIVSAIEKLPALPEEPSA